MDRRFRSALAASLLLSATSLIASNAFAAPKDATAQKLDAQAMDDDYLNVRFKEAEEKLQKAIKECGSSGCSPNIKAKIYIHLGIIQVNAGKGDDATKSFTEALKADPAAAPEADYTSDAVQKAFEAAKGGSSAATPATPADTGTTTPAKPAAEIDLKFDPPTEALVDYPLPLWVGAQEGATRFLLFFKTFGAGEFTKLEMKKMGRGFGVEIPCGQTNTNGTLKYYIQALDSSGDVVSSAGSRKTPLTVKLASKLSGEQPAFPGKDPPDRCASTTCPPGLEDSPECRKSAGGSLGSEGDSCSSDSDCKSSYACVENTCRADGQGGGVKKNFLSLSLSLDDAIVSSGEVCSAENYDTGAFNCFRTDNGALYRPGSPSDSNYASKDRGTVAGLPFAVGTFRVLLGYDRLLIDNFAAGVRLGYAFNGGPDTPVTDAQGTEVDSKKFLPFHFEVRGTYWIGKDVLSRLGVRPFVFVGGGAGQVDAKIGGVPVSDDCQPGSCPTPLKKIKVDAWRRMGQGFVDAGGGMVYAVNKTSGLLVELKASFFFPTTGIALSPSIGYMHQL